MLVECLGISMLVECLGISCTVPHMVFFKWNTSWIKKKVHKYIVLSMNSVKQLSDDPIPRHSTSMECMFFSSLCMLLTMVGLSQYYESMAIFERV
jgi:hypothetical protein